MPKQRKDEKRPLSVEGGRFYLLINATLLLKVKNMQFWQLCLHRVYSLYIFVF